MLAGKVTVRRADVSVTSSVTLILIPIFPPMSVFGSETLHMLLMRLRLPFPDFLRRHTPTLKLRCGRWWGWVCKRINRQSTKPLIPPFSQPRCAFASPGINIDARCIFIPVSLGPPGQGEGPRASALPAAARLRQFPPWQLHEEGGVLEAVSSSLRYVCLASCVMRTGL